MQLDEKQIKHLIFQLAGAGKIPLNQAQEKAAAALGFRSWNALSAKLKENPAPTEDLTDLPGPVELGQYDPKAEELPLITPEGIVLCHVWIFGEDFSDPTAPRCHKVARALRDAYNQAIGHPTTKKEEVVTEEILTHEEAFSLLDQATAVTVDSNVLVYPRMSDDEEEPIFMEIENDEIHECFATKDNQTVHRKGATLTLTNTRGEKSKVLLLGPVNHPGTKGPGFL